MPIPAALVVFILAIGTPRIAAPARAQAAPSQGTSSPNSEAQSPDQPQSGQAGQAREAFEATLKADPANATAQAGEAAASESIALEQRAAGQMDEALRTLLRARGFAPQNGRLLYDLGILEEEMHLYQDADQSLAAAEQADARQGEPGQARVLYGIARVKMDLGQLAPAEEKMQAYLKLRPDDASAHFGLGRIYQIGLQFEKAKAEFQRSVELQPLQTESYFELGDLALKQGSFDEALAQFGKALERDPKHGGALEGSGEASFQQKHYEQAAQFLERAIAASPDYAPSHYYYGLTLARLGRKEDSERELAAASKLTGEQQSAGKLHLTPPSQP